MFRIKPTKKYNTAASGVVSFGGVLEELIGQTWTVTAIQVTLTWLPGGNLSIPVNTQEVTSLLRGTNSILQAPSVIRVNLTQVDYLQLGCPFISMANSGGRPVAIPAATYASGIYTYTCTALVGIMKLFPIESNLIIVRNDITDLVEFSGTALVLGRIDNDGNVVRDWQSLRYEYKKTYANYSSPITAPTTFVVAPGSFISVDNTESDGTLDLSFEFVPLGFYKDTGAAVDLPVFVKSGHTTITLDSDNAIVLVAPTWVLLNMLKSTGGATSVAGVGKSRSAASVSDFHIRFNSTTRNLEYRHGDVGQWTILVNIPASGEGGSGSGNYRPLILFDLPVDETANFLHVQLEISSTLTFDNPETVVLTDIDATGWWVFNGISWEAVTTDGILAGYGGQKVMYLIGSDVLTSGELYYIRYKVKNELGEASDYRGTTVIG